MGSIGSYGQTTNCTATNATDRATNCTVAHCPAANCTNTNIGNSSNGTTTNIGSATNGTATNGTSTNIGHGTNGTTVNIGDTFDVTKYGAVGNGLSDDYKAFLAAWKAICARAGEPKLLIPEGTYLLSPISFDGPCKCNSIIIEVSGEIIAPALTWSVSHKDTWISFRHVNGLVVHGNGTGTINGRGSVWWKDAKDDTSRPTALRFSDCQNLAVDGLNHVDSQRNHISITECDGAALSNLIIKAPPTSPNTDGVDIANSRNIQIHDLRISTGDDCIAINGGSFRINITKVACGPGHGISIGSLGKDGKHEIVEEVHVSDCRFIQTDNGVRIKTWQGGSGFAKGITFTGITLEEANNPIIIDQYYCPYGTCENEESAVEVSDITYSGFVGTSINTEAISFNCSKIAPCSHILLDNINITYAYGYSPTYAHCVNALGIIARSITSNLTCPTS